MGLCFYIFAAIAVVVLAARAKPRKDDADDPIGSVAECMMRAMHGGLPCVVEVGKGAPHDDGVRPPYEVKFVDMGADKSDGSEQPDPSPPPLEVRLSVESPECGDSPIGNYKIEGGVPPYTIITGYSGDGDYLEDEDDEDDEDDSEDPAQPGLAERTERKRSELYWPEREGDKSGEPAKPDRTERQGLSGRLRLPADMYAFEHHIEDAEEALDEAVALLAAKGFTRLGLHSYYTADERHDAKYVYVLMQDECRLEDYTTPERCEFESQVQQLEKRDTEGVIKDYFYTTIALDRYSVFTRWRDIKRQMTLWGEIENSVALSAVGVPQSTYRRHLGWYSPSQDRISHASMWKNENGEIVYITETTSGGLPIGEWDDYQFVGETGKMIRMTYGGPSTCYNLHDAGTYGRRCPQ